MKRTRWIVFGGALGAVVACGGATFTGAPGDGGGGDDGSAGSSGGGSSSSSSSGAGSSSGSASSSGASSSGASSSGGGSSSSGSGGSSGAGSSGGSSSGARCDAGCADAGASPCPTVAPTANTACTRSGLECEYGAATVQACDTVATCGSSGWTIQSPTLSCSTMLPNGCPGSYSQVPQGTTCLSNGLVCDYVLGRCSCNAGGGIIHIGPDGGVVASWYCQAPAMGCPTRRPPLGSTCTTPNLSCDYGSCYVPGGTTETCTNGLWVQSFSACPA